jgi:hypothetical protein
MLRGPRWRVFPWDPAAPDGAAYSAHFRPPPGSQTGGRFDIGTPSVLYLASAPEHAIAELLQRLRGKRLKDEHLLRADRSDPTVFRRLALVDAYVDADLENRLLDLDSPAALAAFDVRPSQLATHRRTTTQAIARQVHHDPARFAGFEWWSALTGAWRSTIVFLDRVPVRQIRYGTPVPLDLEHPAIAEVRDFLEMG